MRAHAGKRLDQSRFPAAAGADDGNAAAGIHHQVGVIEHGAAARADRQRPPGDSDRLEQRRQRDRNGLGASCRRDRRQLLEQRADRRHRRLGAGAVVVVRGEQPQGLVDLRRHQQAEQPDLQRQRLGAKIGQAEIGHADIERDAGNADRREEFEHGRRQEGDAQHRHGADAQLFARLPHRLDLGGLAAEQFEREDAAQPVGEMRRQPAERRRLGILGGLGAVADQRHEEGDQRSGDQKQQADDDVERQDDDREGQRQHERLDHRRQVAREEPVHCVDLVDDGRADGAGCTRGGPAGAMVQEFGEQRRADRCEDAFRTDRRRPLADASEPDAQREKPGDDADLRRQRVAPDTAEKGRIENVRQQVKLQHQQRPGQQWQDHRRHRRRAAKARERAQPAAFQPMSGDSFGRPGRGFDLDGGVTHCADRARCDDPRP